MNKKILSGLTAILISLLIISCAKEKLTPTVKFVPEPGFTGKDTIMKVNYTITVTIEINWNGTDLLEKLDVKQNDVLVQSVPISGESVTLRLNITKGTNPSEKWTFVAVDVAGNQSDISLTLTKDPNSEFGAIDFYNSVVIGAQNNTVKGGFISFQTYPATTYTLEGAFVNQAKIDLFYYSDALTQSTLASAGSDLPAGLYPGAREFSKWTVLNVTKFLKSTMTVLDFNNISNDAPIVNSWIDNQSVSKAGELKVDDVWLVKFQSGKKAVILVKRIIAGDTGEIEYAVKIQK